MSDAAASTSWFTRRSANTCECGGTKWQGGLVEDTAHGARHLGAAI